MLLSWSSNRRSDLDANLLRVERRFLAPLTRAIPAVGGPVRKDTVPPLVPRVSYSSSVCGVDQSREVLVRSSAASRSQRWSGWSSTATLHLGAPPRRKPVRSFRRRHRFPYYVYVNRNAEVVMLEKGRRGGLAFRYMERSRRARAIPQSVAAVGAPQENHIAATLLESGAIDTPACRRAGVTPATAPSRASASGACREFGEILY